MYCMTKWKRTKTECRIHFSILFFSDITIMKRNPSEPKFYNQLSVENVCATFL